MKRVLIISQNSLSLHANNGKTLTRIFSCWGAEALAQLYFQDEIPETRKFKKFFRVRDKDILKSIFRAVKHCGGVVHPKDKVVDHREDKGKLHKFFIFQLKKLSFLKGFIREKLYVSERWMEGDLDDWIRAFDPEVLFVVSSVYKFTYDVSLKISKKYNVPLVVYFTDDFLGADNVGFVGGYKEKVLEVIRAAKGRFVIGEEMARVYREKYELDFSILINPVEKNVSEKSANIMLDEKSITIIYAGGLTLGRFESVLSFCDVISASSRLIKKNIIFKVCSGDRITKNQLRLFESKGVCFLGRVEAEDLNSLYQKADFALHVESSLQRNIEKTKLSVSTKVPECLSSGIGLIAYGPSEIASMKLIYENYIGFYIDSRSSAADSARELSQLLSDEELYSTIVDNGLSYASKNFSVNAIRDNLFSVINKL